MNDCLIINEHELHVEVSGPEDGLPVVLLHHGLGSTRAWKAQTSAFAAAGWRAIAYDRWGYGLSEARPAFSMPFFNDDLDDLARLLDLLRLEQVSLVGHSDGGTIALYFASQRHDRVRSLVSIAAHIYYEPRMELGIEGVRLSYEHDALFREGLARVHGEKSEAVFWGWYNGWRKPEHTKWDIRPALRQIESPALIIQGKEDEHATPQHALDIASAISGAELWLVPGVKHMLPQGIPEAFNQRVLGFLEQTWQTE